MPDFALLDAIANAIYRSNFPPLTPAERVEVMRLALDAKRSDTLLQIWGALDNIAQRLDEANERSRA